MRLECERDKYRYIRLSARFQNAGFGIDSNTTFCVDTGAPYSIISYEQAVEWGIDFNQLEKSEGTFKVGGIEARPYFMYDNVIIFRDFKGKLKRFEVPRIVVLGSDFKRKQLPVPALLGDDILGFFTLVVESKRMGGRIWMTDERIEYDFV